MSSAPEFNEKQLAAARAKTWHQDGDALLTLEAAREWLSAVGIALYAPRPQFGAPAPSFVEATLGAANDAPTAAESEVARGLLARMTADGVALPLNLLGVPGDTPDFVVSAQVFSFIFTLRGDKGWKQPPVTSGAVKVSPLSLHVYEVLADKGALTAAELASELGREVTEPAVLRSLVELWSQLRVIPLVQPGEGATLWELTTRRFTKSVKAGANAGQPTALSALVSLYLAQAMVATEEEIESFLSPLTARSRVRDVLHALLGARQLETVVLEGKTLLHIPGTLPAFAAEPGVEGEEGVAGEVTAGAAAERPKKVGTGRISSFKAETKAPGEFRGKAVRSSGGKPERTLSSRPARPGAKGKAELGKPERERRPFKKDGAGGGTKDFSKPWNEDKKPRAAKAGAPAAFRKFEKPAAGEREPLGPREQAGLPEEQRTDPKRSFQAGRPSAGAGKRPYAARDGGAGGERGGAKRSFAKPAFGGGARTGGFGAKKPFAPRDAEAGERPKRPYAARDGGEGGARPFAKPAFGGREKTGGFGAKKPFSPREGGAGERAKRPYTPRAAGEGGGFAKPAFAKRKFEGGALVEGKRPFTPREGGDAERPKRPYTPREGGEGERPKRPYTPRAAAGGEGGFAKPRFGGDKAGFKPRSGGDRPFAKRPYAKRELVDENAPRTMPKRPYKPRAADADQRVFTKAPWTPPAEAEGGARPKKSFGSKPRFGGKGGGFRKPGGFAGKRGGAGASKPRGGE